MTVYAASVPSEIVHALHQMPLFQTLAPVTLEALAPQIRVRTYRRGAPVPLAPELVYIVAQGGVHLYRLDGAGRALTLGHLPVGTSFAALPGDYARVSPTATRLYVVPRSVAQELYQTQPAFAQATTLLLYQRLAAAYTRMEDLALGPITTRLARLLGRLAEAHPERRVSLSHQDLAEVLGARREQITKTLRSLQARGLVAPHACEPGLVVRDPATLLALAEEGDAVPPRAAPADRRLASRRRGAALPAGPA